MRECIASIITSQEIAKNKLIKLNGIKIKRSFFLVWKDLIPESKSNLYKEAKSILKVIM